MRRNQCILCGGDKHDFLYDRGRGGNFNTVVCSNCGFVFVSYKPDEASATENYETGGYRRHTSMDFTDEAIRTVLDKETRAASMAKKRYDYLKKSAPELFEKKGSVFDVGASLGLFMKHWRDDGFEVSGCEPDVYYAKLGSRHFGFPIEPVLYGDKTTEEQKFDVVTLCHVLEHCADARSIVQKVRTELRSDGLVYIEVPSIDRPYDGNLDRFFWIEHLNYFSRSTLSALLRQERFEVLKSGYRGWFLWTIAKKSHTPSMYPRLPYDNPVDVKHRTLSRYCRFLHNENQNLQQELESLKASLAALHGNAAGQTGHSQPNPSVEDSDSHRP